MLALLAALPIATILWLMLVMRRSAAQAGLSGLALALLLAGFGFDFGEDGFVAATTGAAMEAAFTTATIAWIILPALCIHELQRSRGTFDLIRSRLAAPAGNGGAAGTGHAFGDPRIVVLLVAWFFGLFMEGAAGFGTPVALGAPILVSLGVAPVHAVALMLVGHAAGVSFGAIGTPVVPQVAATGLDPRALAAATALMHAAAAWVLLVWLHRLSAAGNAAALAGGAGSRVSAPALAGWGWTAWAGACFLLPFVGLAVFVGPELPTLGAALVGGTVFVATIAWARRRQPGGRAGGRAGGPAGTAPVLRAAAPYLILVVLTGLTRLWPDARAALSGVVWQWSIEGGFGGRFAPLYHPGTLLAAAFVAGALVQRASGAMVLSSMRSAASRLPPVLIALLAMLMLSRVMVHAGMIDALAQIAAATAGQAWPVLAPAVGVLGTFVTGSATASNILFSDFQAGTAAAIGIAVLPMMAAQGFGAAVGNIICPHNVVAGAATVGIAGREGEVMRLTIGACVVCAGVGGLLALAVVAFA